jgi:putative OPT family oligopeptide transporter
MALENEMQPPNGETVVEGTVRAFALGAILAVILGAANAYLGLKVGMTVSAAIPAAVISMGLLRGVLRRGTVLENNIVQTIGSAGEAIAAGIIFTVPALLLTGVWSEFELVPTLMIALLGGLLGSIFMIPLRRALIIEGKELKYPEGTACAEILKAGDKGAKGALYLFGALGAGIVYTVLAKFSIIAGQVTAAFKAGGALFAFGAETGLALVSVGYIVGLNISFLVFLGGALTWLVGVPVYSAICGSESATYDAAKAIWKDELRMIGAGAMVIGGLWSIWRMRSGLAAGVKELSRAFRGRAENKVERTEHGLPMWFIFGSLAAIVIAVFVLYLDALGIWWLALVCALIMTIASFVFVAVSSYLVGLVGSSNNPVSGITILTVFFTGAMLIAFGVAGTNGILGTLVVAGVVCTAACAAGDMSQDLKTGYLVRATPKTQQIGQIVGVFVSALIIVPVLIILDTPSANVEVRVVEHEISGVVLSYKVKTTAAQGKSVTEVQSVEIGKMPEPRQGKIGSDELPAPQAQMMQGLAEMMFLKDGKIPWLMLGIGAALALLLIILDEIARAHAWPLRLYVMPIAVGIYLPLTLSVPIFLGGIIRAVFGRHEGDAGRGTIMASGLIAGEALTGIVVAAVVFATGSEPAPVLEGVVPFIIAPVALLAVIAGFVYFVKRAKTEEA